MSLLNPWIMLGALLWTLVVAAAGWRFGNDQAQDACQADKAQALTRAIERSNAVAENDVKVLTAHEQTRERIRTVFKPIREEVIRYVETHATDAGECLDPDGMRIWRAANAGDWTAAAAPKPDYATTGSSAAALGPRGGLAGQPRTDGGDVPRMPGAPESAGRLDGQ